MFEGQDEGLDPSHVQVRGGLVHQEEVGRIQQQPHQRQPALLASAQDRDRFKNVIAHEVVQMVSADMAQMYQIVPFSFEDGILTVAMADPRNIHALDDLRFILNLKVEGAVASPSQIKELIEKFGL